MTAVSIFSDVNSPRSAPPATAAAANSSASNPFVVLLSGLVEPGAALGGAELLSDEAQRSSLDTSTSDELLSTSAVDLKGATSDDALATVAALSDAVLAQVPSDIASALADVAQALDQLKSSLSGVAGDVAAPGDQIITADDDTLTATALGLDAIATAMATPMSLRQAIDAPRHSAPMSGAANPLAASALTLRQRHDVAAASLSSPEDLAQALAKPSQGASFTAALNSTLNSTQDVLAAAKDAAVLAPAITTVKEAMLQAGVGADQADTLLGLSAAGQAVSAAPAPSTSTVSLAAPLNSQWTVPGHALLDNNAWSTAMADRLTWLGQQGMSSATLHITPDDLGPIHVRIQLGEEGAKVAFSADHHDTQGLIERMLPKLTAAFEAQGLRLDDVRVQAGASQAAQLDLSQHQQDREASGQSAHGHMNDDDARSGTAAANVGSRSAMGDERGDSPTLSATKPNGQLDAYA